MRLLGVFVAVWVLAGTIFVPATLAARHVDILVYREGNVARVGAYDFGTSTSFQNYNVFRSAMSVEPSLPGLAHTDSPGWNALRDATFLPPGGSVLPGGAAVGFNVLSPASLRRNLSYWNGAGDVSFSGVPAGEVLQYRKSLDASGVVTIDGSDAFLPGYTIAVASGGGYLHRHAAFDLYGNASTQDTSTDAPTPGVYLVTLQATVTGLTNSAPFHVLLGHNTTSTVLDTAAAWVNQNLLAPPAPRLSVPMLDTNGTVRVRLSGQTGTTWRVEATATFTNWTTLTNVTIESPWVELIDGVSITQRFYRASQP